MIILDISLFIMTVICVIYCLLLNRRIKDLQNSRIEFARMIKELNISIVKAENNVHEMHTLGEITNNEIQKVVNEAKEIYTNLQEGTTTASKLLKDLYRQSCVIRNPNQTELHDTIRDDIRQNEDKFTKDDLSDDQQNENYQYTNRIRNFIQNIVTHNRHNPDTQKTRVDQAGYYSSLRKINVKRP